MNNIDDEEEQRNIRIAVEIVAWCIVCGAFLFGLICLYQTILMGEPK